ncbi:MAG TPA: cell envelope integrity protein CreD [Bacteroidia bacterium]|nr:cell envelope integrity protein CreD [Bacteroidia bacterium]
MEKPSLFDRINDWIKRSVTIKLLSIGFLILILLIPTSMLTSLIRERQDLRNEAIREVSSKWGNRQTLGGPVLTIPYRVYVKDEKGNTVQEKRYAHFLPDELNISGGVAPEQRHRGIYIVVLYNTQLKVSGKFGLPDVKAAGIEPADCYFDQAFIAVGISDLRGIKDDINCRLNDSLRVFGPGIPTHDLFSSGLSFHYPLTSLSEIRFSFDINLNGSTNLSFLPFGKVTTVDLNSNWGNPSFEGSFLPDTHSIRNNGFDARWKVLQLNRNYPQQGTGNFIGNFNNSSDEEYGISNLDEAGSFGVRLILPVDEYLKTMRSVKYCLMFVIITFLTFFFVEVINKRRIHPIQYLLVGFAVCLFYVMLLSISEHLTFNLAYIISCILILSLITFYARFIFKNNKLTAVFSFLLLLLYGFFYSLLQLEDYALLLGSIGLFIILATIMILTRKVNWYRDDS